MKCWWCGDDADSREHKYKKTDLTREFGKGPYLGTSSLVRVFKGRQYPIHGPDSKQAKFQPSLCAACNNIKSQPFDMAYDEFCLYIKENEISIIEIKQIMFKNVFNLRWKIKIADLIRYYVKHICCRLAERNIPIESDVIDYLNGSNRLKHFRMNLEIRDDIVALLRKTGIGYIAIGDLMCLISKSTGSISNINSHFTYRWLRLNYEYDLNIGKLKTNFSKNIVHLNSGFSVDPEKVIAYNAESLDS